MSTKREEPSEGFPTLSRAASSVALQDTAAEGPASRSLEAARRGARASRGRQPRDPTSVLPDGNSRPGPPSATAPPGAQARPQGSSPPAATALSRYKMAAGGGRRSGLGAFPPRPQDSGPAAAQTRPHAWTLTFPDLLA